MENKNKILIVEITAGILVIIAVISWYFYFKNLLPTKEKTEILSDKTPVLSEEHLKQLKELEALRTQMNIKPLAEKETQSQLKELEASRKTLSIKSLTQEEMQKQLEELDKLRQSAQ